MAGKKMRWQPGDNFLVPLDDGSFAQGQVLSVEKEAMNSVICAFSSARRWEIPDQLDPIPEAHLIAILFVTQDLLDSGRWQIVNNGPITPWEKFVDIRRMRSRVFIGVTITGSFNAEALLNAYHRLVPWDDFYDPQFLDKLLISPDRKPANVLLK